MVIVWIVRIFTSEELFIVTDTVSVKITISIGCIERIESVGGFEAVRHTVVVVIRIFVVCYAITVCIRISYLYLSCRIGCLYHIPINSFNYITILASLFDIDIIIKCSILRFDETFIRCTVFTSAYIVIICIISRAPG